MGSRSVELVVVETATGHLNRSAEVETTPAGAADCGERRRRGWH
jgi:hypothetical protein